MRVGLHELVLPPGDLPLLFHLGVDAYQTDLVAVERGVAREKLRDDHWCGTLLDRCGPDILQPGGRYTGGHEYAPLNLNAPLYHEEQRFRQWWVWALVVAPAALAWWPFIQQIIGGEPVGQNPAPDWAVWVLWLLIGLALPFLFGRIRLVIEVTDDQVSIRYWPFSRAARSLSRTSSRSRRANTTP